MQIGITALISVSLYEYLIKENGLRIFNAFEKKIHLDIDLYCLHYLLILFSCNRTKVN